MANLNSLFLEFNNKIKLSSSKKEDLRTGRDALRKDIKDWFAEKNKIQPKFYGQGSFSMNTTLNPLSGNEYDLDDGVYLQGYSDDEIDNWPSATAVHSWIKSATDEQTSKESSDKNTCVRVNYAADYHIDLPIYIEKDDIYYLAHKADGWTPSDPKEFTEWFVNNVKDNDEQLRRLVRYLKSWKDYKGISLKSIEITILIADNFDFFENRDDKSLNSTISNIIETLEDDFKCIKPSSPYNDLFEDTSETKKSNIISALKTLRKKIELAISETDEKKASEIIRDQFGTRFPLGKETEAKAIYETTNTPGVIKHDGRSG